MIIQGDARYRMSAMEDNSVDAIITDPPYGLNFMGKKWDYDVPDVLLWKEAMRVLKPGGYLLSFAGTRTYHRMCVNIEDAGFEIRDMISWLYGSGFPKSLNIGKQIDKMQGNEREVVGKMSDIHPRYKTPRNPQGVEGYGNIIKSDGDLPLTKGNSEWEGWGTALKPACEPIVVARKPLSEKNVALNVLKWGTGGINIDSCRVGNGEDRIQGGNGGHKETYVGTAPYKKVERATGGRFPANIILDEEAGKLLDAQTEGKVGNGHWAKTKVTGFGEFGNGKSEYFGVGSKDNSKGGASRFFYCAKASKSERNFGCEDMPLKHYLKENKMGGEGDTMLTGSGNPRDCRKKNNHPTVKPIKLMEYLVKLVTKPGATVLDPFLGSGTTAIACLKQGRKFIGIEKEEEYIKIVEARIKPYMEQTQIPTKKKK